MLRILHGYYVSIMCGQYEWPNMWGHHADIMCRLCVDIMFRFRNLCSGQNTRSGHTLVDFGFLMQVAGAMCLHLESFGAVWLGGVVPHPQVRAWFSIWLGSSPDGASTASCASDLSSKVCATLFSAEGSCWSHVLEPYSYLRRFVQFLAHAFLIFEQL